MLDATGGANTVSFTVVNNSITYNNIPIALTTTTPIFTWGNGSAQRPLIRPTIPNSSVASANPSSLVMTLSAATNVTYSVVARCE